MSHSECSRTYKYYSHGKHSDGKHTHSEYQARAHQAVEGGDQSEIFTQQFLQGHWPR